LRTEEKTERGPSSMVASGQERPPRGELLVGHAERPARGGERGEKKGEKGRVFDVLSVRHLAKENGMLSLPSSNTKASQGQRKRRGLTTIGSFTGWKRRREKCIPLPLRKGRFNTLCLGKGAEVSLSFFHGSKGGKEKEKKERCSPRLSLGRDHFP